MPLKGVLLGKKVVLKRNPWVKIAPELAKSEYIYSSLPEWTGSGARVHGATAAVNKVFKYISSKLKDLRLINRIRGIASIMRDVAEGGVTDLEALDARITAWRTKHPELAVKSRAKIEEKRKVTRPRFESLAALIK